MKEKNKNKEKYCEWCGVCVVKVEKSLLPITPILEFIEKKIDNHGREEIWGGDGDWSEEVMDPDFEAELLVYDQMMNNVDLRIVCDKCIKEDQILFSKYYGANITDIENLK